MNRAVRRQQLKEPKPGKGGGSTSIRSALPRAGTTRAGGRGGARTPAVGQGQGVRRFIPRFVLDIYSELKKVIWPSREDTLHLAVVVVIVTIIFGAILGGIDVGFAWLIDKTLLR